METEVYFLNVFFEVEKATAESLGDICHDLKKAGNLFITLGEAKEAQLKIKNALCSM